MNNLIGIWNLLLYFSDCYYYETFQTALFKKKKKKMKTVLINIWEQYFN